MKPFFNWWFFLTLIFGFIEYIALWNKDDSMFFGAGFACIITMSLWLREANQ